MNLVKLNTAVGAIGFLALLCGPLAAPAQSTYTDAYASMIGEPPFEHALPVRFGQVNLQTGSIHLEIPIAQ